MFTIRGMRTTPLGGVRGFRKIEAGGRYEGQRAPDWTMAPDFMRVHAECQYQFIRSIWEDRPTSPSFFDGLHIQRIMDAAERSSERRHLGGTGKSIKERCARRRHRALVSAEFSLCSLCLCGEKRKM